MVGAKEAAAIVQAPHEQGDFTASTGNHNSVKAHNTATTTARRKARKKKHKEEGEGEENRKKKRGRRRREARGLEEEVQGTPTKIPPVRL